MTIKQLIAQSNRIEGIKREPLDKEVTEFKRFMDLPAVTVADMEQFVHVYQRGATLREKPGMDVRVGDHHPPRGGPEIRNALIDILHRYAMPRYFGNHYDAYLAHINYETLHPFMDGNGRSGRMLWYWMMRNDPMSQELGFLHCWYYQSLGR